MKKKKTAARPAAPVEQPAAIAPEATGQLLPDGTPWRYDPENAKEIMRMCGACHAEGGEGGGGGVYPRIAGLHSDYLADQIRLFKSHERENIPMIPFATERELPEKDVLDVSRWLSEQKPPRHPPGPDVQMAAYERLQATKKVVQIPREPGDIAAGKAIYDKDCADCHGDDGFGRGWRPPLAQQYIRYLRAQIESFLNGKRQHRDTETILRPRSEADWQNVWAYVSTLDD